jgi:hypothetical protein
MTIPAHIPPKSGSNPAAYVVAKHKSFADEAVTVRNPSGGAVVDEISAGVHLSRAGDGGLINILEEDHFHNNSSPANTSWNADGWEDLHLLETRYWTNFRNALDNNVGQNIINSDLSKLVMRDNTTGKFYKFEFHFWQAGGGYGGDAHNNYTTENGGFSYTRQEIFMSESVNFDYAGAGNPGDHISENVRVVRGEIGGIYNDLQEEEWNPAVSPAGLLWNTEGWKDLTNITEREYHPLFAVTGALGQNIQDKDYVLYDVEADEYYQVKFYGWEQEGGGAFHYVRTKLNKWASPEGIRFGDGSIQTNAAGDGLDMIKAEYWGYPDNTVQIKNAQDNDSIALASTSNTIVRWQAREQAEPVKIESLVSINQWGSGPDTDVTFSVDPDRVMLDDYVYYVSNAGEFNGAYLARSGGNGTVTLWYQGFIPSGDPTGGTISGPSRYSQVQAQEDGIYIKTAQWDANETHQYFWQFMHDGGIRFPDGTTQYTAWLD